MKSKTEVVRRWIENYIMDLNLCPFSHASFLNNALEYVEVEFVDENFIKSTIIDFIENDSKVQHSLLLIFGEELSWEQLLELNSLLEFFMTDEQSSLIKLVLFHPEYQHGEIDNELLHYTNRSPLPIIQFLHLDALTSVISEQTVEKILVDNEETLNSKSVEELNILLNGFR